MMVMITGTVDTSSPSVIEKLDLDKVSPTYSFTEEVADDILRFNFPKDYTIKMGCQFDVKSVRLYKEDNNFVFSVLEQPLGDHILLRPYLYNPNKNPKTKLLDEWEDSQFFAVPKYYAEDFGFYMNDNITYTYVHESEDRERHVVCNVS